MNGKIILLRHAHRDTSYNRWIDNGLSAKGAHQVEQILSYWSTALSPEPGCIFYSSPKKRCLETVRPLAQLAGKKVRIDVLLDEQQFDESWTSFLNRIERFLTKLRTLSAQNVFLCTHGDWIPEGTQFLLNEPFFLKKGRWMEIPFRNSSFY